MITIVTETERKSQFVGADQSNGEWDIFITTHVVHVVSLLFAVYSGQPSVSIVLANIKTNMPFFFFSLTAQVPQPHVPKCTASTFLLKRNAVWTQALSVVS